MRRPRLSPAGGGGRRADARAGRRVLVRARARGPRARPLARRARRSGLADVHRDDGAADDGDAAPHPARRRASPRSIDRAARRRGTRGHDAAAPDDAHAVNLENHVIVAGYGDAARQLVRVLHGSRMPYVITTLSPGGALEAEAEGLPVLRGDASKALDAAARRHRARQDAGHRRRRSGDRASHRGGRATAGADRAHRRAHALRRRDRRRSRTPASIASSPKSSRAWSSSSPTCCATTRSAPTRSRRTRMRFAGAGYAVLREEEPRRDAEPVVVCQLDGHCLATRASCSVPGCRPLAAASPSSTGRCRPDAVARFAAMASRSTGPASSARLEAGDEMELAGTADAFAAAGSLFRIEPGDSVNDSSAAGVGPPAHRHLRDH